MKNQINKKIERYSTSDSSNSIETLKLGMKITLTASARIIYQTEEPTAQEIDLVDLVFSNNANIEDVISALSHYKVSTTHLWQVTPENWQDQKKSLTTCEINLKEVEHQKLNEWLNWNFLYFTDILDLYKKQTQADKEFQEVTKRTREKIWELNLK